jgi:radical SAM superfamily enzyme YgiQ (UPF0313 family)
MNKRIFFVNAPVLAVLEPWFDAPKFIRTALASLAAFVREQNSDWEIKCLDAKFEGKSFIETRDEIVKWNPDVVCFTAFTNEIKPAAYLAGLVKRQNKRIKTVIGGAHITAIPTETMWEFPTFDIGVMGEGEQTIKELLIALQNNQALEAIKGVVYRNDAGEIIKNSERPRMLEQDSLPMAAWDLFPPAEEYYIQTVRGCPFNCVFCLNHNGKVARKRGVQKVIDEMNWLINYGAKRISFGDELFSVDMHRTEELLEAMIEEKIGERVSWDIQTHVSFVNDNLFEKMSRAKIEKCEMGVESGDEQALKRMGKATTKEMINAAFKSAKKFNIKTGSFFIIGQPDETYASIWQTIKYAIKLNPTEPIFGTMVPYPGTEVANLAAKSEKGYKLVTTDWDEYRKQLNGSMELQNISRTKMEMLQIFAYVIVFLANFRIIDFLRFFWAYRGGAIQLFTKAFTGKKSTGELLKKPSDYNEVINSPGRIAMSKIVDSREYWRNIQNNEIKRTKKEMPNLLREQMPI